MNQKQYSYCTYVLSENEKYNLLKNETICCKNFEKNLGCHDGSLLFDLE